MKAARIRGYADVARSLERVVDLVVMSVGHLLACLVAGEQWNNASQSATAFAIVAFCLLAEIAGLYVRRPDSDLLAQGKLGLCVWALTLPLLVLFQLVSGEAPWHAGVAVVWAVTVAGGIYGWRLGLRKIATTAKLTGTQSVAILGGTKAAERACADIRQRPWLRMRIAGVYDDRSADRLPAATAVERRGSCADLLQACRRGEIDTVIVALPIRAEARIRNVVEALGDTTATVYLLADLPSLDLLNAPWTAIGSLPLIGLEQTHGNAVAIALRRIARPALGRVAAPVVEAPEVTAHAAADAPPVGPTV